jgi:hypothetical protein
MGRRSVIIFMAEGSIGKTEQPGGWQQFNAFPVNFFGVRSFSRKFAKVPERLANGMCDR